MRSIRVRLHTPAIAGPILAACLTAAAVALTATASHAAPATPADPQPSPTPAPTPAEPAPPSLPPVPTSPVAPAPSPAPAPTPPVPGVGEDECGMFDVACRVRQAVDDWFRQLVTEAINPVFDLLGRTLLATPPLHHDARVRQLWTGSLAVANTCFVLLVVAGGILLMGYQTVQTSTTVKEIAPRLVVAFIAANISLPLAGKAIEIANGLSAALLAPGVDPAAAAGTLSELLTSTMADASIFFVLVVLAALILGLILALIFVVRVMLTVLLIAAAPLALASWALPQTDGLARLWARAFTGVLAIQVAQALVFIAAMRIFLSTDAVPFLGVRSLRGQMELLVVVCLLYILVRIPAWVARGVFRGGLRSSPLARTARTVAALVIFRGLLGKAGGTRAAAATTSRRPHRPPGGGRPPRPAGPSPGGPTSGGGPPRSGPQPRWPHPSRRWTPPDPEWHAKTTSGQTDSLAQEQRWRDPARRWTPPDNAPTRRTRPDRPTAPTASAQQPPRTRREPAPDPRRPWTPPDNTPARSARPTRAATSPRRPSPTPRQRYAPPDPQRPWTPPDPGARSAPAPAPTRRASSAAPSRRQPRRTEGEATTRTSRSGTRSTTNENERR